MSLFKDIIALLSPFTIQEDTVEVPELETIEKRAKERIDNLDDQEIQIKVFANLLGNIINSVHTSITSAYAAKLAMDNPHLIQEYYADPAKYAEKVAKMIRKWDYIPKEKADELGAKILEVILKEIPILTVANRRYLRGKNA